MHCYYRSTNAVCSPSCRNGGTCHVTFSSAYCDCPSGFAGSYCQNSGMLVGYTFEQMPLISDIGLYTYVPCKLSIILSTCTQIMCVCACERACMCNVACNLCDVLEDCLCAYMYVSHTQHVHLPVRMEELAVVHLSMLTVTAPVGTQDPTASTEVHT